VISSSLGNGSTSLLCGDSGSSSSSSRSSDSSSSSSESEDEEQLAGSAAASQQQQQHEHQPHTEQEHQHTEPQHEQQQPQQLQQQEDGQPGPQLSGFRPFDAYAAIHTAPPLAAAQQQPAAVAVHPAMAPIGHPAMSRPMSALPLPAFPQLVPSKPARHTTPPAPRGALPAATKAKSAGDLLKVEAAAAAKHASIKRRHSSTSMPGRVHPPPPVVSSSSLGSCADGDYDASLPEPSSAAPYQYVTCVLNFFGCSRQHQQRQLYVPLLMGMLAACHDRLSCEQAGQLLDRLEVLAADNVPGVRYAVAAALHSLRLQAAAQLQQQQDMPAPCQQQSSEQQLEQQAGHAAAGEEAGSGADAEAAAQDVTDSYHRYVKQLAARSGSSSSGPAAVNVLAAAGCCPAAADGAAQAEQELGNSSDAPAAAAASAGSKGQGGDGVQPAGDAASFSKQPQQPRECCGVCAAAGSGDASPGLEWLVKLSCCQQLERLMGVVVLTTAPV
jgi:hypothetical protein